MPRTGPSDLELPRGRALRLPAAANGGNRIGLMRPRSPDINDLTCLNDLIDYAAARHIEGISVLRTRQRGPSIRPARDPRSPGTADLRPPEL